MKELLNIKHWDKIWQSQHLLIFKSYCGDINIHRFLKKFINRPNMSCLEVGCAPGGYLAYFAKEFDCQIFGFDYSNIGIAITKKNLDIQGIKGKLYWKDILDNSMPFGQQQFDIVCSFGLVEHFENWPVVIKKISEFVKPSGLMITTIPNLFGINGFISKIFRPKIYYGHKKISPADLKSKQKMLNMNLISCNYSGHWFISPPLQMNNFVEIYPNISKIINLPFQVINYFLKKTQQKIGNLWPSKIFSPLIICITFYLTSKKYD